VNISIDLPSSIPSINDYEEFMSSDLFQIMERFSNNFIENNAKVLRHYAHKWVKDPFHQWSRQWEYAFVYSRVLNSIIANRAIMNILDAGSGITFFPYFLKSKLDPINMICCDIDYDLKDLFGNINKSSSQSIGFINTNLENIPCKDESLDIVYCISVIEHTENFSRIIDEFYRVIKTGGKLLITFDISLDGTAKLSPTESEFLLEYVLSKFKVIEGLPNLQTLLSKSDIFSTKHAYKINPKLLPWTLRSILSKTFKSMITRTPIKKYPYLFSFYCLEGIK
jgi:ubiquinone/menaquinone biosynthesis C-methylase UbiE